MKKKINQPGAVTLPPTAFSSFRISIQNPEDMLKDKAPKRHHLEQDHGGRQGGGQQCHHQNTEDPSRELFNADNQGRNGGVAAPIQLETMFEHKTTTKSSQPIQDTNFIFNVFCTKKVANLLASAEMSVYFTTFLSSSMGEGMRRHMHKTGGRFFEIALANFIAA